jgi:FKBP-type peptidyl-prolyl cis-trans isomerase
MKKNNITSVLGVIGLAGLVSFVGAGSLSAQAPVPGIPPVVPAGPKLTDAEVKSISSYVLGLQSSSRFAGAGLTADDIDPATVLKGFLAGLKGDKPEYPEAKLQAAMQALGKSIQARQAKKGEANLAAGNAFLAKNGKRKGVTTTASGMQYEVIKKGSTKKYVAPANGAPDGGTKFMVHYRGTLIDGTEFDKSPEGKAFPMTLQVVPGFKEALTTMPVGAKWKLFLPAALAYGPRAAGPKIGPNSALIFELELVEIQAAPARPVPAPPVPGRPRASAVSPPVQVPVPAPPKKAEKAE